MAVLLNAIAAESFQILVIALGGDADTALALLGRPVPQTAPAPKGKVRTSNVDLTNARKERQKALHTTKSGGAAEVAK
jgi:hypothetical protein